MHMKVKHKVTGNVYTVYNIRYDNATGYPQFLIYMNNQWIMMSAKHYIPVEEDNHGS